MTLARIERNEGRPAERTPPAGTSRFLNRELSWLQFNRRVLEEVANERQPVLERLRFLSIAASNLDEFYMVRAAGLYGQVGAGVTTVSMDGLTPAQQLVEINRFAAGLIADTQTAWTDIRSELEDRGLSIVAPAELGQTERAWLETQFMRHIFPILTPINVDPAHPFRSSRTSS